MNSQLRSQLIHCPHCHKELMVVPPSMVIGVRAIDHRGRASTTFWSAAQEMRRSLFGGDAPSSSDSLPLSGRDLSFDATAAPLFGSSAPFAPGVAPLGGGNLSGGEERWAKTYRERSKSDVGVPLLANVVSSGLASMITLAGSLLIRSTELLTSPLWLRNVQYWIGHKWYVLAPSAFLATMAGLWFGRQLPDLLDDETLIVSAQGHERRPEPPPPAPVAPPAVEVIVPQSGRRGYGDRRGRLSSPAADHSGLWRYCEALAKGAAFPSWEGGKSGPGAKDFGYSGPEFDAWREQCVTAGLLKKRSGLNQGYDFTEDSIGAFRAIARNRAQNYEL